MTAIRTVILAAALLGLAACGSSSSDGATESEPGVTTSFVPGPLGEEPDPAEPVAEVSASDVNAEFVAALDQAGVTTCDVTEDNGYTTYELAPCANEDLGELVGGATVTLTVYRSPEQQQEDLSMQQIDLGLKGWTWGQTSVTLLDQSPDPEVIAQLDQVMEQLGGTVEFDDTTLTN
jgi:uncharacterized lipoprotein